MTRRLAETEEKVMTAQDVVAFCKGTMGSLSEAALALVDGDSVVICLSIYTALSLLWTLARLTHIWWTGPNGGRFPPDVTAAWLFATVIQYLWTKCRDKLTSCFQEKHVSPDQSANVARLRAYLNRTGNREADRLPEEAGPSTTGLQGPSFLLVNMSETADRRNPLVDMSTRPFLPVPTAVLSNRVVDWVNDSADSGRLSAPTSEIASHSAHFTASGSGVSVRGHPSDNEDGYASVHEDNEDSSSQASTVREKSSGTSDLDANYDEVACSVDSAVPQVSNLSLCTNFSTFCGAIYISG